MDETTNKPRHTYCNETRMIFPCLYYWRSHHMRTIFICTQQTMSWSRQNENVSVIVGPLLVTEGNADALWLI